MGTYGLDGVLLAWKSGAITTEQAVGQILQLLKGLEERLVELERLAKPTPQTTKKDAPKKN
ncbi:MAG: hypothetical protein HYZ49_16970 [Chloroflexi bacterium]|nr:hypothetical protein [Chloroflexota bacterium]